MCGIAGFTGHRPDGPAILADMIGAIAYRGPDALGVHVSESVGFAHARLAVVDLQGGAQPMVDDATGDALIFNGEIYGYRETAARLRAGGVALRDRSDTAVLFALLQQQGVVSALGEIEGMFAFAWWHGATRTLMLARDRFGEKPLYWAQAGEEIVFGSEASAILAHPSFRGAMPDPEAAAALLRFEYLPGTWSGWRGVHKLPPGSLLTWTGGVPRVERYWSPPVARAAPTISEDECLDRLDAALRTAVRRQVVADVPLGIFLSGGLDSSLIAALAAREAPSLTALSVRAGAGEFDETVHAAAVAKHIGLRHQIVELGEADLLDALEAICERLAEPLADSSLLPTYLVCRAARASMTVALGGDGADELFAGYPNFRVQRFAPVMRAFPRVTGTTLTRLLDRLPPAEGYMSLRFRLAQLAQGFGEPASRQSYFWMAPFGRARERALWRELPENEKVFAPVEAAGWAPPHEDGVEALLHRFLVTYLPDDILTKTDRAAMFNSLEVRAPFLDVPFASLAAGLPSRMKLGPLGGKHILKRLALRYLPRDIVLRRKHGFAVPVGGLMRGVFRERVTDVLMSTSNPVAFWFNRDAIESLLAAHMGGRVDGGKRLWALFILFVVAGRAGGTGGRRIVGAA